MREYEKGGIITLPLNRITRYAGSLVGLGLFELPGPLDAFLYALVGLFVLFWVPVIIVASLKVADFIRRL